MKITTKHNPMKSIIVYLAILFSSFGISLAGTGTIAPVVVKQYGSFQTSCNGVNDGQIDVTITSGNGPFKYDLYNNFPSSVLVQSSGWLPDVPANRLYSFVNIPAGTGYFIVVRFNNDNNDWTTTFPATYDLNAPPAIVFGSINGTKSICYNTSPGKISSSVDPIGGNGAWTYDWEYSDNCTGTWTTIVGAHSNEYTELSNLVVSRCYRRIDKNSCGTNPTNTVTISVYTQLTSGSINPPALSPICNGTKPTITNLTDANGPIGFTYQWEYDPTYTGAGYVDIAGANQKDLTNAPNLTSKS